MKRAWGVLIIALLVVAGTFVCRIMNDGADRSSSWIDNALPPGPDAIVFQMKYRGLGDHDDDPRYSSSSWFSGQGHEETEFLQTVRSRIEHVHAVFNPHLKGAEWAALELHHEGGSPVALYLDVNADGKLDEADRILPKEGPDARGRIVFITPDFMITNDKGVETPWRLRLECGASGYVSWMPSCVLEGQAIIKGRDVTLQLFAPELSGPFTEFGKSDYKLRETTAKNGARLDLSRLITYGGDFYRVRFLEDPEQPRTIRTVLDKDCGPTGRFAIRITGANNLKTVFDSGRITDVSGDKIRLRVRSTLLPKGAYRLDSGSISYGLQDTKERGLYFTSGSAFSIKADKMTYLRIGKPRMMVSAVAYKDRYSPDIEERFSYSKGAVVFLSPRVEGARGEKYGRFTARGVNVEPTVEILDSAGTRVASGKMEYG